MAIKKLLNAFLYATGFDYDYDSYYPCGDGSDCCNNDYCRCRQINDAHVTSVPTPQDFARNYANTNEDIYVLERLLSNFRFWDISLFEVEVCNGYYGQEIDQITFNSFDGLSKEVNKFSKLSFSEQIESLLILEYGYLLESCKNKTWKIKTIDRTELLIPQDDYHKKVHYIERYSDYDLPRGVAVKVGDNAYRLIDGYHRVSHWTDGTSKIVVGE